MVTNYVAIWLAGILAVLIGADFALTGGETLIYLVQRFLDLMDWVEFWR